MSIRVVPSPQDEPAKLTPEEVVGLWDSISLVDDAGEAYLEKRGLTQALDSGLVRFAGEAHPDKRISGPARQGYRVACLLTDVGGSPRGIELRLHREPQGDEPKSRTVRGSSKSKAFFGSPDLIEAEPLVCVTEGMADTLAVAAWVEGHSGMCVVGGHSKSLATLAKELEAVTAAVEGKLFVLFPKNDRPKNVSRREFTRLKQLLIRRGARVVLVATHEEFKDVAAWRQAHPEAEWPPSEVARALAGTTDDERLADAREVLPTGLAVAIPAEVRTEHFAQDFTTLCALLDDPMHREAIMGRGDLTWCEMTWRVRVGGRELAEVDHSTIRPGLEAQGRSTDGKPLKFSEEDIAKALTLLARRKPVHPVREWLSVLRWDGQPRIEADLPRALGHQEYSFAGRVLLRWMVAAVARAMVPGCKVDTVLVLVGPQGFLKSTFFEVLGGAWFTDTPVHVGDKDGKLVMRRAWVIEWAELESMRRARDQEALKGFLSARVDLFRKPYGRDVVEAPRHCVIVGSTNQEEYLGDATGSRRFWTVKVKRQVDADWVREHREQLWAEAVTVYSAAKDCAECEPHSRCANHRWWLTEEEELHRAEQNAAHEEQHPWLEIIRDWLDAHLVFAHVTPEQVLVEAVGMEVPKIRNVDQQVVGAILRKLDWTRVKRRVGPGGLARWVFVRSSGEERATL